MTVAALFTFGEGFFFGAMLATLFWVVVIVAVFYTPTSKVNHKLYQERPRLKDEIDLYLASHNLKETK